VVDGGAWTHVAKASRFANLRHGVFAELLPDDFGDRIRRLDACAQTPRGGDIFGDGSIVAVPLPGHAAGHFGVWIGTKPDPIFYAVDTQWLRKAAVENRTVGYPARAIMDDYAAFRQSSAVVAQMIADRHTVVFCHDPDDTPFDLVDAAP